jgi:hypothetical protein
VLDARWWVFGKNGEQLIGEGRSTIVEPVAEPTGADAGSNGEPGSYEAIVAAMSTALARMSSAIAGTIGALASTYRRATVRPSGGRGKA